MVISLDNMVSNATETPTTLPGELTWGTAGTGSGARVSSTNAIAIAPPGTWAAFVRVTAVRDPEGEKFHYLIDLADEGRGTCDRVDAAPMRCEGRALTGPVPKRPPPLLSPLLRDCKPPAQVMGALATHCSCGGLLQRVGDVKIFCPDCESTWYWQGYRSMSPGDQVWVRQRAESVGSSGSSTCSSTTVSMPLTSRESFATGVCDLSRGHEWAHGRVAGGFLPGDGCGAGCRLACVFLRRGLALVRGRVTTSFA